MKEAREIHVMFNDIFSVSPQSKAQPTPTTTHIKEAAMRNELGTWGLWGSSS